MKFKIKYIIFVFITIFIFNKLFDMHNGVFPTIIKERHSTNYDDYLSIIKTYDINTNLYEYSLNDYKLFKLKTQKNILDFFMDDGYSLNLKYSNNGDNNLLLNSQIYITQIESDREIGILDRSIYDFNQSISIDDLVIMINYTTNHGNNNFKYIKYKFLYNKLYYYGHLEITCKDSCNIEVNTIDMIKFLTNYIKETYQFID